MLCNFLLVVHPNIQIPKGLGKYHTKAAKYPIGKTAFLILLCPIGQGFIGRQRTKQRCQHQDKHHSQQNSWMVQNRHSSCCLWNRKQEKAYCQRQCAENPYSRLYQMFKHSKKLIDSPVAPLLILGNLTSQILCFLLI